MEQRSSVAQAGYRGTRRLLFVSSQGLTFGCSGARKIIIKKKHTHKLSDVVLSF